VRIEGGPAKHELLRRMLSYLRVSFKTTDGQMEVLIEEMQEMNVDGHRFVFIGRIASGAWIGAHVKGDYVSSTKSGRLEIGAECDIGRHAFG
jgi:hypothetical protein